MKENLIQGTVCLPPVKCTNPCNLGSQALDFVPSAFHFMWHKRAGYLRSFSSCPPEAGLKNKVALQVLQSSLKLPLKERPLDTLLAPFPPSMPVPLKEEGAESIATRVWVYVSSYVHGYINEDQHGTLGLHCFTEGLCLLWGPGN